MSEQSKRPMLTLKLSNVTYAYANGYQANSEVSFELKNGIIGLLGPNGAGKTTLMKMIATINTPSKGDIAWCGQSIASSPNTVREILGYLPQDFGVFPTLTAREFLHYIAVVKEVSFSNIDDRVAKCLDMVGLTDKADEHMSNYSGGMRQRVGIAQALLNDPQLLIVDEPTVGLDPEERLRFRNLLTDLASDRIIILSTHIVSDIEASATHLCVLNKGKLQFDGTPEQMIQQAEGKIWEMVVSAETLSQMKQDYAITTSIRRADGVVIRVVSESAPSEHASRITPSLEDAYVCFLKQLGNE